MVQARPQLQVALKYAKVEMTPPKLSDIPAIRSGKRTVKSIETVLILHRTTK